jgi:hypothetical protein
VIESCEAEATFGARRTAIAGPGPQTVLPNRHRDVTNSGVDRRSRLDYKRSAPTDSADPIDVGLQTALDDLVAWDPVLIELAPDPPPGPGQDMAVGSQKVTQPSGFQHVRVSAHSGPSGENPRGNVRVTYQSPFLLGGSADVKGSVTCLAVTGTSANVAALLSQPFMGFTHVTLILNDLGNPGPFMGQSPDLAFVGFTSAPPATCASGGTTLVGEASGNIVVKDAT